MSILFVPEWRWTSSKKRHKYLEKQVENAYRCYQTTSHTPRPPSPLFDCLTFETLQRDTFGSTLIFDSGPGLEACPVCWVILAVPSRVSWVTPINQIRMEAFKVFLDGVSSKKVLFCKTLKINKLPQFYLSHLTIVFFSKCLLRIIILCFRQKCIIS